VLSEQRPCTGDAAVVIRCGIDLLRSTRPLEEVSPPQPIKGAPSRFGRCRRAPSSSAHDGLAFRICGVAAGGFSCATCFRIESAFSFYDRSRQRFSL